MRAWSAEAHPVPLPPGHRFPMDKYRLLREACVSAGVFTEAGVAPAPLASPAELEAAHDPAWVGACLGGTVAPRVVRRIGFPWSPALVARCRASVGGTVAAARDALAFGFGGTLAGGTHHAGRAEAEGFCVFNDLAVAARVLLAEGAVQRVAIVDLDVHQGNGTADILAGDGRCFLAGVHGDRNFPFRKVPGDLDIPLADGTGDAAFLDACAHAVSAALAFHPDLLLFQAGVDALETDRLGRLHVSPAGMSARDRLVLESARAAGVPVVLTLGGGYGRTIESTVNGHLGTWLAAREICFPRPRRPRED